MSLFMMPRRPKTLLEQLIEEEMEGDLAATTRFATQERSKASYRKHPHGPIDGIFFQQCGGGRRIIRRRIGGD